MQSRHILNEKEKSGLFPPINSTVIDNMPEPMVSLL